MATLDEINEIKKLPPEEKIQKLKELEEERKKAIIEAEAQIKEAESQIKNAEEEIDEREETLRKISVPELTEKSIEDMFTAEDDLEKAVQGAKVQGQEAEEARAYINSLSMVPVQQLDQRVDYLRNVNEEFGRLTDEQYSEVRNIGYALAQKDDAAKRGAYTTTTDARKGIRTGMEWVEDMIGIYKG
jgi:hypothetical protein